MDARRDIRKKLTAFVPVRDKERAVILGYLGNLTLRGALVIGERPVEVNSRVTLEIEFPSELFGVAAAMIIHARATRCAKDEESARDFNIGFEFLELAPEHTQTIRSLLERYRFSYEDWDVIA
jgi:hypothetical protein